MIQPLAVGTQKCRVAESCERGGVTAMEGGRRYGGRMLTLRQAAPLFLDDALWQKNNSILELVRPILTNTHTAVVKIPLSDALVTPANVGDFLRKSNTFKPIIVSKPLADSIIRTVEKNRGQFILEVFKNGAWLFPIDLEFLDSYKIRLSDSGKLFVAETNLAVIYEGDGCYRTAISNPLQNLKVESMTPKVRTQTDGYPLLFGDGGRPFKVYLWFNSREIKISFACVGSDYYDYDNRLNVVITSKPDVLFGVLVKE